MIQTRDLSFSRGGVPVLRDLSFDIRPGEILAVLGPNGAGKTTLLRLLAGSERPTHGDILLNGSPLAHYTPHEMARLRSVVSQNIHLALPYVVLDLVLLGRLPHNRARETAADIATARAALRDVHACHLADRRYTTLSGGEQQRIHIARALAQLAHGNAAVSRTLLLDEPTAHLDPGQSYRLMNLLRSLRSATLGIAVVLHDLNLAARYADRILLLSHGTSVACGTPQETLTPERVAALYGSETTVISEPGTGIPIVIPAPVPPGLLHDLRDNTPPDPAAPEHPSLRRHYREQRM